MNQQRRQEILRSLSSGEKIKGDQFAKKYEVTRQVIVKDIAILRAEGHQIVSTPRGYFIHQEIGRHIFVLKNEHPATLEAMAAELRCIVEHGGVIVDVIIEHQVYHEIRIVLDLHTQKDIDIFMMKFAKSGDAPLLVLTKGLHYHTITVDTKKQEQEILQALAKMNDIQIVEVLDK